MPIKANNSEKPRNGGEMGFEQKLWAAADALRNNMDAAEYKHVVLGLIFLKYISDAFEARRVELEKQKAQGADPEDPDEYRAASGQRQLCLGAALHPPSCTHGPRGIRAGHRFHVVESIGRRRDSQRHH